MDAVPLRQLLTGECWSEVVPARLLQDSHRLILSLCFDSPIGDLSAQPVNHHSVPTQLQLPQSSRTHRSLTPIFSAATL